MHNETAENCQSRTFRTIAKLLWWLHWEAMSRGLVVIAICHWRILVVRPNLIGRKLGLAPYSLAFSTDTVSDTQVCNGRRNRLSVTGTESRRCYLHALLQMCPLDCVG